MSTAADASREMRAGAGCGLGSREASFWPHRKRRQWEWVQERRRGEAEVTIQAIALKSVTIMNQKYGARAREVGVVQEGSFLSDGRNDCVWGYGRE